MNGVPAEDNASSNLDPDSKQPLREEVEGGSDPQTTPTEEIQLTDTSNLDADAMEVEGEDTVGSTQENYLRDDTVTCRSLENKGCSTTLAGGCQDGETGKTNANHPEKAVCESSPIKDAQAYSEGLTPDGSKIETGSEVKATPRDNTPIEAAEDTTPAAVVQGASSELQGNG